MAVLPDSLLERVAKIIPRYNMAPPGSRVGVAVSGGADSVVLVHIFHRLASELQIQLSVLHVNHHLRGEESDADEQFVRKLAGSLNVNILVKDARVEHGNIEQAARDARRRFFLQQMQEGGLTRLALGHTRSDQAETVLFRLLRGTGLRGLAGMRVTTPEGFIRPLLTTGRDEVRTWAEAQGITWRDDSSNDDVRFARNRLRRTLMPVLVQDFNPNVEAVLAGTASLASAEEEYWSEQIDLIYPQITKRSHLGDVIDVSVVTRLPLALQRRVIRRALERLRGNLRDLELAHIEAILSICRSEHGHDRVLVPGADAIRSFGQLLLAVPGALKAGGRYYRQELVFGHECELPFKAGCISINWIQRESEICANFKEDQGIAEVVDLDGGEIARECRNVPLAVRNWEPGDQLHRPGHQGAEKIKALFQEYRVPLWARRHWPVLVLGNKIIWARRFGCANSFQRTEESGSLARLRFRAAE